MIFTHKLVSNVKNLPGDMLKTLASRWNNLAHQKMTTTGNEELDIPALFDDPLY
jgi:hypothetical protein